MFWVVGHDGKLLFVKNLGFFYKAGETTEMFCVGIASIISANVCMFVCVAGQGWDDTWFSLED